MAWTLHLRDEKGNRHPLQLPRGGESTVRELKQMVCKVSKVPQYKQVWKAGFPPKIVFSPLTELSNHEPVSRVLSDRDLITLEAASAKELTEAIARSAQEDAAKEPGTEQHGAAAQPSFAGGAADGHGAACLPDASSPAAALRTAGPAAGTPVHVEDSSSPGSNPKVKRRKANFPGAARMLDAALDGPPPKDAAEAVKRTEDGAMTALLQAARGGAAAGVLLGADWSVGNKSLLRALRSDMRQAREGRAAEAEAHQKLAAARSGQVTFRDLDDGTGRMEVVWRSGKESRRECVPALPPFVLAALLITLHGDEDAVVAQNLSPLNMAQLSPRSFWALVRHGGVSTTVTFTDALCKVVPSLDWNRLRLDSRQRKRPAHLCDA